MQQSVQEVLDMIKGTQQNAGFGGPVNDRIMKAGGWTTALGIVNFDLQKPALATYPWMEDLTPLRNALTRRKGNGGLSTNWRAITGINTKGLSVGVSQGNRNALLTTTAATYSVAYQGIGFEDAVTFEADYAAEDFDDAKARSVEGTLRATMLAEEVLLIGGNVSVALGTTPTPVATPGTSGGLLADGTYFVGCVALTMAGLGNATVSLTGVEQLVSRLNVDGSTDYIPGGCAAPSLQSSGAVVSGGSNAGKVTAHVAAVQGAVAYAWYLGSSAGALYLQAITTLNSVAFTTALVTTTQQFVTMQAVDYSQQTGYAFDGLLSQTAFSAASLAYYKAFATGADGVGTKLTSDGAAGINEIDAALETFYTTTRGASIQGTGPDEIWCNAQHILDMTQLIIKNGGAPLVRFAQQGNNSVNTITGGNVVMDAYLNKFTQRMLRLRIHPNLPVGTIVFRKTVNPYPTSGVGNCDEVRYRRDYYEIDWPLRTRKYEYGVYADEVYVNYMPFLSGAMVNVQTGT